MQGPGRLVASVAEVTREGWGAGHIVGGRPHQQLGFYWWGDGKPLEGLSGGVVRSR